jgi:hypothetical protein
MVSGHHYLGNAGIIAEARVEDNDGTTLKRLFEHFQD